MREKDETKEKRRWKDGKLTTVAGGDNRIFTGLGDWVDKAQTRMTHCFLGHRI